MRDNFRLFISSLVTTAHHTVTVLCLTLSDGTLMALPQLRATRRNWCSLDGIRLGLLALQSLSGFKLCWYRKWRRCNVIGWLKLRMIANFNSADWKENSPFVTSYDFFCFFGGPLSSEARATIPRVPFTWFLNSNFKPVLLVFVFQR